MGGDANQQFLSLLLGVVTTDPLYLELQFKVPHQHQKGTNTPEYLIAWIDNTPVVVPLPPAFLLLGSALAGGGAVFAEAATEGRTEMRSQRTAEFVAKGGYETPDDPPI